MALVSRYASILCTITITILRRRVKTGIDYQNNNIKKGPNATQKNVEIELKIIVFTWQIDC